MKSLSRILPQLGVFIALTQLCTPLCSEASGLVVAWGQIQPPNNLANIKALTGSAHTLALNADGTLLAWGQGTADYNAVPPGLSNISAIAAGSYHNLAVRHGNVIAWGQNLLGVTNVPPGLVNVVAVAAGMDHSVALRADGTVIAWGSNSSEQTNIPPNVTGIIAIAAGNDHTLALRSDGTVVAWGFNSDGQCDVPLGLSNVTAIAAGKYHSLALKADGTVAVWGNNIYGQTIIPSGLAKVIAIAAGGYHNLALKVNGTVIAWGNNNSHQCDVPAGLSNVTLVAAGSAHSLALISEGPIEIVQQPQSMTLPNSYPSNVTFMVTATGYGQLYYRWYMNGAALTDGPRITGANTASLSITNLQSSDAGIYRVVVSNSFGSVTSSNALLTVYIPPFITLQPVSQTVRVGADVTFTAMAEGTPPLSYQWTFNGVDISGATTTNFTRFNAQPGVAGIYAMRVSNPYDTAQTIPVSLTITDTPPYFVQLPGSQVAALGSPASFSTGARGSPTLRYQWKFNGVDIAGATSTLLQLNQLRYDQTGYYSVEVTNAFGSTNSPKVLLNVSQVLMTGSPFSGNTNMPLTLSNVIAVAAGGSHAMVLKTDGTVQTWLANANATFDQSGAVTNVPIAATNLIAIAAGRDHCVTLRSNGSVIAWGGDVLGQSTVPAGLSNVVGIAAGSFRSYAVRSDGTVAGWGFQPAVPAGLSNVVAMSAGPSQNLALKGDGTVVAWATSGTSLASVPPGLSNVIAISAGASQNQALLRDGTVVAWVSTLFIVSGSPSNAVAISAGVNASMLLRQTGVIATTGLGNYEASLSNTVIAISVGGVQSPFGMVALGTNAPAIVLHPISQTVTRSNQVQLHARAISSQAMRFQWWRDTVPLAGATNASLLLTNFLGKDTGAYQMSASNALGIAFSRAAHVGVFYNVDLAASLNATNLLWLGPNGDVPWFAQPQETHDGNVAAQSGLITNSGRSTLQVDLATPGTLSFWWKVSSEEGFDFLHVYVDGGATPAISISGETGWEQRFLTFTNGGHTVRWVYAKDATVSAGRDAGWLDEVTFTALPGATVQPVSQTATAGAHVNFIAVNGGVSSGYQWLRFGTNLAGATNQTLSLSSVGRKDRGSYSVQVSSASGTVLTADATLWVNVPQRLQTPRHTADEAIEFLSRDVDGAELTSLDLPSFEAQVSTNLIHWQTVPGPLSVTNGSLLIRDAALSPGPNRFYRLLEH